MKTIIDNKPYDVPIYDFIDIVKNKTISVLHFISDQAYIKGLQKLIEYSSRESKIKYHVERTIFFFKKN